MNLSSLLPFAFLALAAPAFAATTTLTVAAASDLTALEPVLDRAFYETNSHVRLRWVNAASAILSQQIDHGAPYDIFMSANVQYITQLASNGKLLRDSVAAYGVGRLGLLWHDGKHHPVKDLTQSWVRFVALPNPQLAPYGVAARHAVKHEGLWKQVQPKIVYGENVRETLEMFDSGNADAVITSDSLLPKRNPQIIPQEWHQPILQKAGVVAASPNRAAAEKFMQFLVGSAGQAVFAQFGFSSPK
ncbi:MAG: molybdate ABC transporter substrate-binding protein [Bryobacteraceae bacterium]